MFAAGGWYITGLRADLAVSQENEKKTLEAIEQQKAVIEQIRADQAKIQEINSSLTETVKSQKKDLNSLQDRFNTAANGDKRDIGSIAVVKPKSIERAINRGTENAARCFELLSGAELTEDERNATSGESFNKECPWLWPGTSADGVQSENASTD